MAILDQIRSAFLTGIPPDLGRWSYLIIAILVFMEGPAVTLVAGATSRRKTVEVLGIAPDVVRRRFGLGAEGGRV